jgi:hypothetical protein
MYNTMIDLKLNQISLGYLCIKECNKYRFLSYLFINADNFFTEQYI